MKVYANDEEDAWSSRLESVRKDIECVFGRIKGRFRIFKTALLFSTREKVDNAWFTACIIHNMLLQFDGLGKLEEDMDWVGKDGMADGKTGRFAPETLRHNSLPGPAEKTFHDFRQQLVDLHAREGGGEDYLVSRAVVSLLRLGAERAKRDSLHLFRKDVGCAVVWVLRDMVLCEGRSMSTF